MTPRMSTSDAQTDLAPRLRFPEFRDGPAWTCKPIAALARVTQGGTPDTSNAEYWVGPINWLTPAEMSKDDGPYIDSTNRTLTEEGLRNCSSELLAALSVIVSTRAPIGHLAINTVPMAINQGCRGLVPVDDAHFLYYSLLHAKPRLMDFGAGNTFKELSGSALKRFELPTPSPAEQQKIAACLGSLDDLIAAEGRNLQALRDHKKGLMQQIFPREGETRPRLRFPEFQDAGDWEAKPLSAALDYEQPGPFIVSSENYGASGTPVLTAGKTFILGYTDETDGLYDRLPVIIFDDFTTASQFVAFPFKVKSSAMKILSAREGYSLKFTFEGMSLIEFDASQHKRYWIAECQHLEMPFPNEAEQQRIADCLASCDAMKAAQAEKLDALRTHKRGLMQQLFPSPEDAEA